MIPKVILGGLYADQRGSLRFNNDFDASVIKRFYVIENQPTDLIRGWQGHKIEQRWFSAMKGSIEIRLIAIDNWENPSKNLETIVFTLNAEKLDVLHVPSGYITSIQFIGEEGILFVMSDYLNGEIIDEYRYNIDYFEF